MPRGKYPERTIEEYERGYIAWCGKQSVRHVARTLGRSEKLAKSYIEEGWSGQPSYRMRLAAEQEELRKREEVAGRKSISESMREMNDMLQKGIRALTYVNVSKYIALAEDIKLKRVRPQDLADMNLPKATEEILRFLKIYEVMRRLAGISGPPKIIQHEVALTNVETVLETMPQEERSLVLELLKEGVEQIETQGIDDGQEAE